HPRYWYDIAHSAPRATYAADVSKSLETIGNRQPGASLFASGLAWFLDAGGDRRNPGCSHSLRLHIWVCTSGRNAQRLSVDSISDDRQPDGADIHHGLVLSLHAPCGSPCGPHAASHRIFPATNRLDWGHCEHGRHRVLDGGDVF